MGTHGSKNKKSHISGNMENKMLIRGPFKKKMIVRGEKFESIGAA